MASIKRNRPDEGVMESKRLCTTANRVFYQQAYISRIFAAAMLFSAKLPSHRPGFVTYTQWDELKQMEVDHTLVQIVKIDPTGFIRVVLPELFDIMIHSRVTYGPELNIITPSIRSRFRWWTDTDYGPFTQLKPFRSSRSTETMVNRDFQLPPAMLTHLFVVQHITNPEARPAIIDGFAQFFIDLLRVHIPMCMICLFDFTRFGFTDASSIVYLTDIPPSAFDILASNHVERWSQAIMDEMI